MPINSRRQNSPERLAPRIEIAVSTAVAIHPDLGGKGVAAIAKLANVEQSLASRWISQAQLVPIKRAMLIEINSAHCIRAEDLLCLEDALLLAQLRRAAHPSEAYWQAQLASYLGISSG